MLVFCFKGCLYEAVDLHLCAAAVINTICYYISTSQMIQSCPVSSVFSFTHYFSIFPQFHEFLPLQQIDSRDRECRSFETFDR